MDPAKSVFTDYFYYVIRALFGNDNLHHPGIDVEMGAFFDGIQHCDGVHHIGAGLPRRDMAGTGIGVFSMWQTAPI